MRSEIVYMDIPLVLLFILFGNHSSVNCAFGIYGCLKPAFLVGGGFFTPEKDFYKVKETVCYECYTKKVMRYLFGNSNRTCLENGTWSGYLPYCVSASYFQLHRNLGGQHVLIDGETDTCLNNSENKSQVLFDLKGTHKSIIVQIISNRDHEEFNVFYVTKYNTYNAFKYEPTEPTDSQLFFHWYVYNSPEKITDSLIRIELNSCTKKDNCAICEVIVFADRISSCPLLVPPNKNTFITFDKQRPGSHSFSYGNVAFYTCREGFRLEGNRIRRCDINNSWTAGNISCVAIECSLEPPTLKNAIWKEWKNGTTYSINYTLKAICKSEYINYGQPLMIKCSSEGLWSPHVLEDFCKEESTSSFRNDVIIAIAVVVLILICLCIGCSIFWTRRCITRRSQKRIHQTEILLENPIYNGASPDLQNEEYNNSVYFQSLSDSKKSKKEYIIFINKEAINTEMVKNELYLTECPVANPLHACNSYKFHIYEEIKDEENKHRMHSQPTVEKEMQKIIVKNEIYNTE